MTERHASTRDAVALLAFTVSCGAEALPVTSLTDSTEVTTRGETLYRSTPCMAGGCAELLLRDETKGLLKRRGSDYVVVFTLGKNKEVEVKVTVVDGVVVVDADALLQLEPGGGQDYSVAWSNSYFVTPRNASSRRAFGNGPAASAPTAASCAPAVASTSGAPPLAPSGTPTASATP